MSYIIPSYAVWPITIPDASLTGDGVMTKEMVAALNAAVAVDDVLIHVPGDAPTMDAAIAMLPGLNEKQCKIFVDVPGVYPVDLTAFNPPRQQGALGTPLAIIGGYTDEVGTLVALSTNGGAAASTAAGAPFGQLRITGLAGMTTADVGRALTISGAATPANNGSFTISGFNNAASVDIYNFAGVTPDANDGSLVWDVSGGQTIDFAPFIGSFAGDGFISCHSGPNAGLRCQIKSNTATTVTTVGMFFFGPIAPGDTFIIEKTTVTLAATGNLNAGKIVVGLVGVTLSLPATVAVRQCIFAMEGCVIDGGGFGSHEWFPHNFILSAAFSVGNLWEADGFNSPFSFLHFYAGTCFQNINVLGGSDSTWDGIFFFKNCGNPFVAPGVGLDGCDLFMPNVETDNAPLQIGGGAHVSYFGPIFGGRATFDNSPGDGIVFDGSVGAITGRDIENSAGDAVLAKNRAFVTVQDVGGTTNAGAGLHPLGMSQIAFDPFATTVTGGGGDTLTDGMVNAYAALSPDGYNGLSGGVLTLNRIAPIGL